MTMAMSNVLESVGNCLGVILSAGAFAFCVDSAHVVGSVKGMAKTCGDCVHLTYRQGTCCGYWYRYSDLPPMPFWAVGLIRGSGKWMVEKDTDATNCAVFDSVSRRQAIAMMREQVMEEVTQKLDEQIESLRERFSGDLKPKVEL